MSFIILLHSSKTMVDTQPTGALSVPAFQTQATELSAYIATLTHHEIRASMHVSESLATGVYSLYQQRSQQAASAAVEVFRGDIYSGLRARDWTERERQSAQRHLRILSGLYGILKPYDGIRPYRLEAATKLPLYPNLYTFWGEQLAHTIDGATPVINLTSAEYTKLIIPYLRTQRVVTPTFLSMTAGETEPTFVAVHAKIARGAYARWLITHEDAALSDMASFNDLGYHYDEARSTHDAPVYVCQIFEGKGLSQRLS